MADEALALQSILTYCGMTDDDYILFMLLGPQAYFERRLRELINISGISSPRIIYQDMIDDPYGFYLGNVRHFRMPMMMMVEQFERFRNII